MGALSLSIPPYPFFFYQTEPVAPQLCTTPIRDPLIFPLRCSLSFFLLSQYLFFSVLLLGNCVFFCPRMIFFSLCRLQVFRPDCCYFSPLPLLKDSFFANLTFTFPFWPFSLCQTFPLFFFPMPFFFPFSVLGSLEPVTFFWCSLFPF